MRTRESFELASVPNSEIQHQNSVLIFRISFPRYTVFRPLSPYFGTISTNTPKNIRRYASARSGNSWNIQRHLAKEIRGTKSSWRKGASSGSGGSAAVRLLRAAASSAPAASRSRRSCTKLPSSASSTPRSSSAAARRPSSLAPRLLSTDLLDLHEKGGRSSVSPPLSGPYESLFIAVSRKA